MTAAIGGGCAKNIVATAEPICANVKPVCPVTGDQLTERTATRALRSNEALRATCGAQWAQCPRGSKVKSEPVGPPAPAAEPEVPKTS